ncbi:unnamed protein product [Bursaphelenchus okinawaensis]|uniref:Serine/threonine-protein phosphatase 2A 55 kDa regulatory subunit B n=1 Tax=Bursaphelenchus okinawaensis TaxID=465554 RepID=A0A811LLJ8_9BILA|nr:unnamed protein product [Bursaphelenchus okinawaensis]CAG9123655.1 unnamed protein product [Bursaphelenchus okinawaensis]
MERMECAEGEKKRPDQVGDAMDTEDQSNSRQLQWRFSQLKGAMDQAVASDADQITTVQFSEDGELLTTGDRGGRIVIFKRSESYQTNGRRSSEYAVYSTFQSHEPEFDYLKSLEIEEKINQIKWMKKKSSSDFLLSTNDKTIKLWKISERRKQLAEGNFNLSKENNRIKREVDDLLLPQLEDMDLVVEATPRRVYSNAHTYHINSISLNADQDTFISADDLRINLWHHEITKESFTIVDIKPANMEELVEVITSAEFHPQNDFMFAYGSSKGLVRLCDTRQKALCDDAAKIFEAKDEMHGFFSEIVSSVSDVKFSNTGRYLLTRDYLSAYVWDIKMDSAPIETYSIHDYLRNKLCTLYENDAIFDKFESCWSGDDSRILSGSYNNYFRTFDRQTGQDSVAEANYQLYRQENGSLQRGQLCSHPRAEAEIDNLDFDAKIMHSAWHPKENIVALAAGNLLYVFDAD